MAWVYVEQFFKGGEIQDPRDFNKNMQTPVAEMAQLDRDNLQAGIVTNAKIVASTIAVSGNKTTFTGQFNKITFWEATASTTIDLNASMNAGENIADLGGSITTLDSSLIIDLSLGYEWNGTGRTGGGAAGAGDDMNRLLFQILVDDLVVADSGELSGSWLERCLQLYAQTPVGAGSHTIRAQVRGFWRDDSIATPVMENALHNLLITDRSLLVREVRR